VNYICAVYVILDNSNCDITVYMEAKTEDSVKQGSGWFIDESKSRHGRRQREAEGGP